METKLDDLDSISLSNYTFIHQSRRQKCLRRSGGIGVFIRNELVQRVKLIESSSDYVLWLQVSETQHNKINEAMLGVVYQPPESSRFLTEDEQELLEVEITSMCISNEVVYLVGDMNARVSNENDFIDADTFFSDYFDFDEESLRHFNKSDIFSLSFLSQKRANQDTAFNKQGESLLNICKSNNLLILNGRCHKDKGIGKYTFRDISVIDYAISSTEGLKRIQDFEIMELDSLYSDGHAMLSLTISYPHLRAKFSESKSKRPGKLWDEDKKELFQSNVDIQQINGILYDIQSVQGKQDINLEDIDILLNQINSVFQSTVEKTFPPKQINYVKKSNDKPWFGNECNIARNNYNVAKSKHNKNPSPVNKKILIDQSKQYKLIMNKHINNHNEQTKIKLRNLHTQKPKEFWKIINSAETKSECSDLNLNEFLEYFHTNNMDINEPSTDSLNINIHDDDYLLNAPITIQEVLNCVKILKNNKACGNDRILNEYIKSTLDQMMPIYVQLFNLILDSGEYPSIWLEGIIRPIYKRSGDITKPENYRPITILSCFSKLFTSILNVRLNKFIEQNVIMEENQAGFRKGYSTTDQIFTLHALMDILKTKKKEIILCIRRFQKSV